MAAEDDRRYNDDQWRKFRDRWIRVRKNIGAIPKEAQREAASKLARRLRAYMRAGVAPKLSIFTIIMKDGDRPALSTLARFVVVEVHEKYAIVTFRSQRRLKMASLMEYGYSFKPSPSQKAAMWASLKDHELYFSHLAGGSLRDDPADRRDIIVVPPRPFMHVITGRSATKLIREVAEKHLAKALEPVTKAP